MGGYHRPRTAPYNKHDGKAKLYILLKMQNLKLKVPAAHLFEILVIFILKTDFYLEKTELTR